MFIYNLKKNILFIKNLITLLFSKIIKKSNHTTYFSSIYKFITNNHIKLKSISIILNQINTYTKNNTNHQNLPIKSSKKLIYLSNTLTITIKFLSPI